MYVVNNAMESTENPNNTQEQNIKAESLKKRFQFKDLDKKVKIAAGTKLVEMF